MRAVTFCGIAPTAIHLIKPSDFFEDVTYCGRNWPGVLGSEAKPDDIKDVHICGVCEKALEASIVSARVPGYSVARRATL